MKLTPAQTRVLDDIRATGNYLRVLDGRTARALERKGIIVKNPAKTRPDGTWDFDAPAYFVK